MPGEVFAALKRLDDRKEAVVGPEFGSPELTTGDRQAVRNMLSGLDLDYEEVESGGDRAAEVFARVVGEGGGHPVLTAKAIWIDALITGMLLAEARG